MTRRVCQQIKSHIIVIIGTVGWPVDQQRGGCFCQIPQNLKRLEIIIQMYWRADADRRHGCCQPSKRRIVLASARICFVFPSSFCPLNYRWTFVIKHRHRRLMYCGTFKRILVGNRLVWTLPKAWLLRDYSQPIDLTRRVSWRDRTRWLSKLGKGIFRNRFRDKWCI